MAAHRPAEQPAEPRAETPGGLRWLFAGQGAMGAAALGSLIGGVPPVAVLTAEPSSGERPVAATAEAHGVDVRHVAGIGPDPGARWPGLFDDLDVAVCCCWAERLQPGALRAPVQGWLNLHPSSLPAWRGADPVAWQLLASPSRIGCSVHRMTEHHDDGPVVADGSVPVRSGDDRGVLLVRSGARLGELAAEVLATVAAGAGLTERVQRADEATWCPPPGTVPLIDPRQMRAAAGARVARAFSPRPGVAVATLSSAQRFAVTVLGRELTADETPGSVRGSTGDHAEDVAVAFRDRWLRGHVWPRFDEPTRQFLSEPGRTRLPGP